MSVGGSIQSISINNRLFPVAADADSNRKLGGFENEVAANGDGSARMIKTRVSWMLDSVQIEVDANRNDHGFLQDISDSNVFVPIVITYVDGFAYQGTGTIEGELQASSQSATTTLNLSGPGKLEPQ